MNILDKNILICGMGRSGISAAKLALGFDAKVTLHDDKTQTNEQLENLSSQGVSLIFGELSNEFVETMDILVLSPGVPFDAKFVKHAIQKGVTVLGEFEFAYAFCKAPVLAITGTNGKTTTTSLLYEIMKAFNPSAEVVGNIGVPFCDKALEATKKSVIVAEVSSFQLESTSFFKPRVAAILNITPDHLDRHKNLRKYTGIKFKIFENQDSKDFAVVNYDDRLCREVCNSLKFDVVYFSRQTKLAKGVYLENDRIKIKFNNINKTILHIDELQILGKHNVENVLAAVAMAVCANVPVEIIAEVVKNFKGVAHRIELVETINGVTYYNDSKATNTDSAIKAIEAMKTPIVLICGGYDKKADFKQWVSRFKGKVKCAVIIGEVTQQIIDTCKETNFKNYVCANSFEEAVKMATENAQTGDCVLLSPACASYDMFENYEKRGDLFKQIVKEMRV